MPEFVCEIAASSASVDLHQKLRAYRRNGIGEYIVWLTLEQKVRWFDLVEDDFVECDVAARGVHESRQFPGLNLDIDVLSCTFSVVARAKSRSSGAHHVFASISAVKSPNSRFPIVQPTISSNAMDPCAFCQGWGN